MSKPTLIVDALYEMTMQRIGDLRCDAAHGRDFKQFAAHERDRVVEPVTTTSSTVCIPRPNFSS